jgi:Ca2+:H+ antiporter
VRPRQETARLAAGWITVVAFVVVGGGWSSDPGAVAGTLLFAWILGVMLWCAFGVITHADHLAEALGEPLGTLILTISIVAIEVGLISALMLGGGASPTVGRDTMFAVMMIVLNGMVGLCLLIGGLRHHEQTYSLPGATAYLGVIIPLTTVALVLPSVTTSSSEGTLTTGQAIAFSVFTLALYGVFLLVQTGRHREFFAGEQGAVAAEGPPPAPAAEPHERAAVLRDTALLVAHVLPIVLLSKSLGRLLGDGISALGAPVALGGVLIAVVVFTPEGVSALRAAYRNDLQRTVNLCLGAFLSTVGLTVPAVLTIGVITGEDVVLGVDSTGLVLIALTLVLSLLTFSGPRTTVLEGAVHLLVFFVWVVLIFSP